MNFVSTKTETVVCFEILVHFNRLKEIYVSVKRIFYFKSENISEKFSLVHVTLLKKQKQTAEVVNIQCRENNRNRVNLPRQK